MPSPSPAPDWVGFSGAVVTAVANTLLLGSGYTLHFVTVVCLFWTAFLVVRVRGNRHILHQWGFRCDNLLAASILPVLGFVAGAAFLAAVAVWQGTFAFPAHALPLFVVYAIWGVIQQFMMLALVAGCLQSLLANRMLLVLAVAALFCLVHIYDAKLAVATFCLELALVPMYLRHRNLWALGVVHGWLGGLFYLWILNRDLWLENFG